MSWLSKLMVYLLAVALPGIAEAQDTEKRIAIVVGNSAYQAGALNTAANDAGLIAQTLEAAGFDVVGARDLDQDTLRRAFRDFLDKAQGSGPNTAAFVYLSGYGLQLEGENYFVPIDARISRDTDIAAQAIRISDYTRPLAALGLQTTIVVLDAARPHPFGGSESQLAGGLALVEPERGMLVAFNAAPDTVAPEAQGSYGPYAQALAEMMREGGLPLSEVFERVRLRVNEITHGAEVPWHASKVQGSYVFFERAPDAPPPPVSVDSKLALTAAPIRDLGANEAYLAALDRDTLEGYLDFLAVYPDDPMARRVRAIVAARREAITWRRTRIVDSSEAYWSYLRRYPRGRHAYEARGRLGYLAAALEPPPSFRFIDYEVAPPPPEEFVYVEHRVLIFDDPVFEFAPPPPPPLIFLAPRSPEFVVLLAPPPLPVALFVLPIPIYRPVPVWVRPPVYVAPPPSNNVIFNNIHNTVVINNTTNVVTITNRSGQTTTILPPTPPPAAAGAPPHIPTGSFGPALPPSVAQKASQAPQGPLGSPGSPQPQPQQPGELAPQQPGHAQPVQPLPGMKGLPLPIVPPTAPPHPGQPVMKQLPGPAPQTGQPLLKDQTPPTAKGTPPIGPPLRGQAVPQQPVPRQQEKGQPPPQGQRPTSGGGPPPTGAPLTEQPSAKQPAPQQPVQPQPSAKGQMLPPVKGAPPIAAHPAQHERQIEQQQQKQIELQKQQQEQQRQHQLEQQRQQQQEQQQRQVEQQRQQQGQQRQRQLEQQRQQQQELQRQRQVEQQRQQQEQQRQRQLEQQRQQQQELQRQRQVEQQRQQQMQQQQRQPPPQRKQQNCGGPGQPACPK